MNHSFNSLGDSEKRLYVREERTVTREVTERSKEQIICLALMTRSSHLQTLHSSSGESGGIRRSVFIHQLWSSSYWRFSSERWLCTEHLLQVEMMLSLRWLRPLCDWLVLFASSWRRVQRWSWPCLAEQEWESQVRDNSVNIY